MRKGKRGRNSLGTPHLERHLGAHVTKGINEEASNNCCCGVGGEKGACAWGTGGWRKEKDLSRDYRPIYMAKTYRISRENGGASAKSLNPTVGVRFCGAPNNP